MQQYLQVKLAHPNGELQKRITTTNTNINNNINKK